ncbi:MAG TPA: LLM class F420-dependent oxidoreductase [Candidatus Dormibacteraeota bacterium]|nr:LLM class F420-dependent oxidoreductase [Candidatus Dormibacteraeota bacterium]
MKLGLGLGYWGAGPNPDTLDLVLEAERLGFDSVWTAEAYGSDALTPLAWYGSRTSKIRLGTSIIQMSARTPAATAMAAMTMDHLSGGRFVLGLGVSGPQVVEGWYGQSFAKPLARTKEYIAIMRQVFARQGPVAFEGEHYPLPLPGGTGLGKALKPTVHPLREDLPIFMAAEGPKNVALAAEIADGWFPFLYSPEHDQHYRDSLAEGFARPGARQTARTFEVACPVQLAIDDDLEAAANRLRPMIALYVGGMGARGQNFHFDVVARMGFEAEASHIQDLYLAGQKWEAMAAVPTKLVEAMALVGPVAKIREEKERWERSILTTMIVTGDADTLRTAAEIFL